MQLFNTDRNGIRVDVQYTIRVEQFALKVKFQQLIFEIKGILVLCTIKRNLSI